MDLYSTAAGSQWKKIGVRQHHGIDIPLFSLRSEQSCGIGEFPDLFPMIDWCRQNGLDVIQLLPLNDGGLDSSPYSALSDSALNPLHLGLSSLPYLDLLPDSKSHLKDLQALSHTQRIDYPTVRAEKEKFLRSYYAHVQQAIKSSTDYPRFIEDNPWLMPYALFKSIKIARQWESWEMWPEEVRDPTPEAIPFLLKDYQAEIDYQCFLQLLCFQQLTSIKKAAEAKGVFIKGDIPILINRESADVWSYRPLFQLDFAAGAPPDMYSTEGQFWGFPLYNWTQMKKSHYQWWKQRLRYAAHFYHLYRLDHIVGFFRIWGIPLGKPAKEGKFIPENKNEWIPQGESIMRVMLASCPMLPIGEDLGVVPPEVRHCLHRLGICGTKVMRWERNWEGDKNFIDPKDYPKESMTTVSTHDSDTLQLWWEKNPEEAKEFARFKGWNYEPKLSLDHHKEILYDSHHSRSLFHINLLNEYLALIPGMAWPDPEDEKINFPGTFSDRNWTYRFRPFIEEIVASKELAQVMRDLLS